jgi:hypothetical protein
MSRTDGASLSHFLRASLTDTIQLLTAIISRETAALYVFSYYFIKYFAPLQQTAV